MLCFRSFPVATKSIDKWLGRGVSVFLMKFFRFTVPKNFIKKRFSASLNLGIEINRDKRGARITIYRRFFFLTVAKIFVEETLLVSGNFWF